MGLDPKPPRIKKVFRLDDEELDEGHPGPKKGTPGQKQSKNGKGWGKPVRRDGVVKNPGRRFVRKRTKVGNLGPHELVYHAKTKLKQPYSHPDRVLRDDEDPEDLQINGIPPEDEAELMAFRDEIIEDLPPMPSKVDPTTLAVAGSYLQVRFLAAVERLGTVARAAQVCGLTMWNVERARTSSADFAERLEHHRALYGATLQEEAYRRAVEGVEETVYDDRGKACGSRTIYSDGLMALLLKATNKEFATKIHKHEGAVLHGHLPAIDADKLRALPPEERDQLRRLLNKLQPDRMLPAAQEVKDDGEN
jgi:hypothetical protein